MTDKIVEEFIRMMTDGYGQWKLQQFRRSWPAISKEERRKRLHFVVLLSAELVEIRKRTNFATKIAEMVIESVIEGEYAAVPETVVLLIGSDAGDNAEYYWRFAEICNDAHAALTAQAKA